MKRFFLLKFMLLIVLIPVHSFSECIYHEKPVKHYENSVDKYKIAILAIHGGRESSERAKKYCEEISRIFPDSKVYSLDFELKGEDLGKSAIASSLELAKYIKDSGKKFVIIGTSFGGFLAWQTAGRVKPEKLIIISGFTRIDKMYEIAKRNPKKYDEWLELIPRNTREEDLVALLRSLSNSSTDIRYEVLFLHGLSDDIVPLEVIVEDIRNIRGKWYILLNNDGHPVDINNPTIKTILQDFVDK